MSSISEQKQQLYEERLEKQAQINAGISQLIAQAHADEKKYLPFGPILMNIYSQARNDEDRSILIKEVDEARNQFCNNKCNYKDNCKSVCETYFNHAMNHGMDHFSKIYKYAYSRTVKEQQ